MDKEDFSSASGNMNGVIGYCTMAGEAHLPNDKILENLSTGKWQDHDGG